tara:strand:+ start:105 stop:335 length:231 start_codon:yes stop_codon:yes gene_type:complete
MAGKKKSLWKKYKESHVPKVVDPLLKYWTASELADIIMDTYSGIPLFYEGGQIKKKIKRKKTKKKPRGWGKARYGK